MSPNKKELLAYAAGFESSFDLGRGYKHLDASLTCPNFGSYYIDGRVHGRIAIKWFNQVKNESKYK